MTTAAPAPFATWVLADASSSRLSSSVFADAAKVEAHFPQDAGQLRQQFDSDLKVLFMEAIHYVLHRWTALRLAIENGWGGVDSVEKGYWMEEVVLDMFVSAVAKDTKVFADELQGTLEDILDQEFSIVLEDGSAREVALLIVDSFNKISAANIAPVIKFVTTAAKSSASSTASSRRAPKSGNDDDQSDESDSGDGDDDNDNDGDEGQDRSSDAEGSDRSGVAKTAQKLSEMTVAPQAPQKQVDADGWEVVPTKRKGKK